MADKKTGNLTGLPAVVEETFDMETYQLYGDRLIVKTDMPMVNLMLGEVVKTSPPYLGIEKGDWVAFESGKAVGFRKDNEQYYIVVQQDVVGKKLT